jgi:hypothetical protein
MHNKISTLARKWGCDVSTIRRWRQDGAPLDAPGWRDMATWLHGRDHVGRGTKNALHALRRAEREAREAQEAPGHPLATTGAPSGQGDSVNDVLQPSGNPTAEQDAHAQRLAQCAVELHNALDTPPKAFKPLFVRWQATLGAIFYYFASQGSDEFYERVEEFARQQNLTPAKPARVPTVKQKPDDTNKAK